jgi:hypothetical protein
MGAHTAGAREHWTGGKCSSSLSEEMGHAALCKFAQAVVSTNHQTLRLCPSSILRNILYTTVRRIFSPSSSQKMDSSALLSWAPLLLCVPQVNAIKIILYIPSQIENSLFSKWIFFYGLSLIKAGHVNRGFSRSCDNVIHAAQKDAKLQIV